MGDKWRKFKDNKFTILKKNGYGEGKKWMRNKFHDV